MVEQPTGTVTFLFTDIEGSTKLLQELGRERYAEALEQHRVLLRDAFARNGGYEVDCEGDAFFVAFSTANGAVSAAAEAQQELASGPVRVRMGLHTGEPLLATPRYVGLDVHEAARITAAGHGGQVLVSQATRDLVDESLELRDLGEHRLKDLTGPRRLYQPRIGGLPQEFPALKTLENRPTNLPVQPNPLIGREQEVHEVVALLRDSAVRLLTLTGTGGTGKTRLALQVAAELLDDFASGVFFVSLAPIRDPTLVVAAIAQTLAVREVPSEELADTLAAYLGQKQMLLVLDNFEQLVDAASALAALLSSCPKLALLVTSRERLRLTAERVYEVPPLALPKSAEEPRNLLAGAAVTLFLARAQATKRDFAVTEHDAAAVAEICRRLDGLPLALELAAARVAVLTPQALLARLNERLKLLTSGARDAEERHRTLRATIEWSNDLLTSPERCSHVSQCSLTVAAWMPQRLFATRPASWGSRSSMASRR